MALRSLKMSCAGVALLKKYQGLSLEKYRDENGLWVIGYGHIITAQDTLAATISLDVAEKLLRCDLAECEKKLQQVNASALTQTQHDALVSLLFSGEISLSLLADITAEITRNRKTPQATRI